ncbi:uncharacterized protein LOC117947648 isoform X3 [Etheostoma cragini]|uniref:uncharacterized protein LOC117947648 isoform X3 n=1 Tax=Etheostoma cragini TaxID=417921 RepID=UPI00155E824D|nr:uncharacterized protein LOC117947648 isoform X3 [Etheostoma cragini]
MEGEDKFAKGWRETWRKADRIKSRLFEARELFDQLIPKYSDIKQYRSACSLAICLLLQNRISTAQGLCESRRPSVTQCTDRRTHASRRGLWEGGVALRGCALLLSFPFFPPSRPSSPPVLRPSPPLTYRLQDSYLRGSLKQNQRGCCPWG